MALRSCFGHGEHWVGYYQLYQFYWAKQQTMSLFLAFCHVITHGVLPFYQFLLRKKPGWQQQWPKSCGQNAAPLLFTCFSQVKSTVCWLHIWQYNYDNMFAYPFVSPWCVNNGSRSLKRSFDVPCPVLLGTSCGAGGGRRRISTRSIPERQKPRRMQPRSRRASCDVPDTLWITPGGRMPGKLYHIYI